MSLGSSKFLLVPEPRLIGPRFKERRRNNSFEGVTPRGVYTYLTTISRGRSCASGEKFCGFESVTLSPINLPALEGAKQPRTSSAKNNDKFIQFAGNLGCTSVKYSSEPDLNSKS